MLSRSPVFLQKKNVAATRLSYSSAIVCATVVLPVPAGPLNQHTGVLVVLAAQDRMSCKTLVWVSGWHMTACSACLLEELYRASETKSGRKRSNTEGAGAG